MEADPIARTIKFRLDENTNTHSHNQTLIILITAMVDLMLSACDEVRLSYKLTAGELLD